MTEKFYDLWNKEGNHAGRIKCTEPVLKSIVENSDKIVDHSIADIEPVSIEIEDHGGNTMMHFRIDENREVEKVKGGNIADVSADYIMGNSNKMYRMQNEKSKGV